MAKVADLVLLSDDPRAVAPEEVANIAVVATIRVVRTTAEPEDEG